MIRNINSSADLHLPKIIIPIKRSAQKNNGEICKSSLASFLTHCLFFLIFLTYYEVINQNPDHNRNNETVAIDIIPIPQGDGQLGPSSLTDNTRTVFDNPVSEQIKPVLANPNMQMAENLTSKAQSKIKITIAEKKLPYKPTPLSQVGPSQRDVSDTRSYTQLLSVLIENNKTIPNNLEIRENIKIPVKLFINMDGKLVKFFIMGRNNDRSMARAIAQTVKAAATQFPPIPKTIQLMNADVQAFIVPIEFVP